MVATCTPVTAVMSVFSSVSDIRREGQLVPKRRAAATPGLATHHRVRSTVTCHILRSLELKSSNAAVFCPQLLLSSGLRLKQELYDHDSINPSLSVRLPLNRPAFHP